MRRSPRRWTPVLFLHIAALLVAMILAVAAPPAATARQGEFEPGARNPADKSADMNQVPAAPANNQTGGNEAVQPPSVWSTFVQALGDGLRSAIKEVRVWLGSYLIGCIGSSAFFVGVWLGFIGPDSRSRVLQFLLTLPPPKPERIDGQSPVDYLARLEEWERRHANVVERIRYSRVAIFIAFGGMVALVFQLTDTNKLIPIQAFVLGATWPSVVTRVMAGSSNETGSAGIPKLPAPPSHPSPKVVEAQPARPGSAAGAPGDPTLAGPGIVGSGDDAPQGEIKVNP